ncbi:MAG: hypothetical protein H6730_33635 [Deltaproteobacteria bacterium]|nr:hypothetical protein [Deltaproteobacteria bacterium]
MRLDPGLVEAHGLRLEVQVEREDWAAADATAARLFELGGPGWAVPRLELLTAQVAEALGERDAAWPPTRGARPGPREPGGPGPAGPDGADAPAPGGVGAQPGPCARRPDPGRGGGGRPALRLGG